MHDLIPGFGGEIWERKKRICFSVLSVLGKEREERAVR
jgi:hypothetical protein